MKVPQVGALLLVVAVVCVVLRICHPSFFYKFYHDKFYDDKFYDDKTCDDDKICNFVF